MRYTCHVKTKKLTTEFKYGQFGQGPIQEIAESACDWQLKTDSEELAKEAWARHRETKHPKPEPEPVQER